MMLRSNAATSQTTSQNKSENPITLTADDIEKFFRVIAEQAYDLNNSCHGTLAQFAEHYLAYLHNGLRNKREDLYEARKRILHEQIKLLIEKQFFKDKLDYSILENIQKDLQQSENNNLPNFVKEEEREDFLSLLRNINETNQVLHASKERYVPEKIQSGMSQNEKRCLNYSLSFQAGSLSINQNNQGIQHYNKREWATAIHYFQAAIVAENEMAAELHITKNESAIAVYQRNIANAYANWADDCLAKKDYLSSIQLRQNAIKEIDKMLPNDKRNLEDRVRFQRALVYATHELGLSYYQQKFYFKAIMQFFIAIARNNEIPESYRSEIELNRLQILLRDIALAFETAGIKEFHDNEIDKSIIHLEAAIKALAKIPEPKETVDKAIFTDICRNLALVVNSVGLKYYAQNNFALALENFDKAMVMLMKVDFQFLTEGDKQARQVYQNNYTMVLTRIEAERTAANIHRFFNSAASNNQPKAKGNSLKRIRSDEILSPRPLKRGRPYRSDSDLRRTLRS